MKKISILFLITFLLSVSNVFAYAKIDEIKALEVIPNGEDLPSKEASYLPKAVEEKLKANLSKYTLINIVDSANKKKILDLQRQSESGIYNSETSIEVGELTNASHALFLNIRKVNDRYTVSIAVTNLTTGTNLTTIVSSNKAATEEELYIDSACVIDLLTIELCDELGCPLTPSNKYILRNGNDDFTKEKRENLYKEDIKQINESIKSLDEEINLLNQSTDIEAEARQRQLEVKKELLQSRLDKREEDIRRAQEEEMRRAEDKLRDMERSDEQIKRIEEKSEELNSKIQQVRLQKIEGLTLLGQIRNIEYIKKTYCEINQEIDETAFRYKLDCQKAIDKKAQEIKNRPLANSEKTSDGHITKTAEDNRKRELKEFAKREELDLKIELESLNEKFEKQKKELLKEIDKGYEKLASCTVTTLGNELVVTFGNYDGERFGWDLYVTVQSDDIILFETSSFLSYETLTGKEPVPVFGDWGYDDYNDTVDFYVSMFSRGEPILTFSLDYYVSPLSDKYPSKYKFNFGNFYCYETEKLKVRKDKIISSELAPLKLKANAIDRQMYPAWDIRDIDIIRDEEIEEEEYQYKMEREAHKKEEHDSSLSKFDFGRTHIAANFGAAGSEELGSSKIAGLELSLNLGSGSYYLNYRMNCLTLDKDKSTYFNQYGGKAKLFLNTFGVGVRAQFGFFETYIDAGIGFDVYSPIRDDKNSPYKTYSEKELQLCVDVVMGMSFIFFDHFHLNVDVDMYLLPITKTVSYIDKITSYSVFGLTIGGGLRL